MKWFCVMMGLALAGCSQQKKEESGEGANPPVSPSLEDEGEGGGTITNVAPPIATPPKPPQPAGVVKQVDLEKRDADDNVVGLLEEGLWYLRDKDEPFTGTVVGMYRNGQKESEKQFKAGLLAGLEVHWYNNGQKRWEIIHKDGEVMSRKAWSPDGTLQP